MEITGPRRVGHAPRPKNDHRRPPMRLRKVVVNVRCFQIGWHRKQKRMSTALTLVNYQYRDCNGQRARTEYDDAMEGVLLARRVCGAACRRLNSFPRQLRRSQSVTRSRVDKWRKFASRGRKGRFVVERELREIVVRPRSVEVSVRQQRIVAHSQRNMH